MALTRETVNDLVERLRRVWADDLGNGLVDEAATALLAAWDELAEAKKAHDVDQKAYLSAWNRAEAAEAKRAERDAENARLREALASVANYMPDENDNPLIVIVRMAGLARAAIGGVE